MKPNGYVDPGAPSFLKYLAMYFESKMREGKKKRMELDHTIPKADVLRYAERAKMDGTLLKDRVTIIEKESV